MPATVEKPRPTSHREELASVRPQQAKAELRTQAGASSVREVAADAIRAVCGNARAAAIDLRIHEAHLSRQLKDGTLRLEQIEALGPEVAARFGQALLEHFGALATPKARAQQTIREIKHQLDELAQYVEVA